MTKVNDYSMTEHLHLLIFTLSYKNNLFMKKEKKTV